MSELVSQPKSTPAERPKVELQANGLLDQAKALARTDPNTGARIDPDLDDFLAAVELDTSAKDLRPLAVKFCEDVKKSTYTAWKAAVAQEKTLLGPIDDTREICRGIMKRWNQLEELAATPAPDPDVQLAIEAAREIEVENLRDAGEEAAARDLAAQPIPQARTAPMSSPMLTPGINFRKGWKGEVKDFDKAVRAIAAQPGLRVTLLIINQSALDDAMNLSQGNLKIDGIDAVKDKTPVNRR